MPETLLDAMGITENKAVIGLPSGPYILVKEIEKHTNLMSGTCGCYEESE